jgi:hypothetical protein
MSSDSTDSDLLILNGRRYWKQARWSRDKGIHIRTTARHRQLGLPWLDWGGEVFIPEIEGDLYIVSRLKSRNPRRQRRQPTSTGISATT